MDHCNREMKRLLATIEAEFVLGAAENPARNSADRDYFGRNVLQFGAENLSYWNGIPQGARSMLAASAKVIDFQAYRSARLAQQTAPAGSTAMPMMTMMPGMAWVPVWYMPVYFVGTGSSAE